MPQLSEKTGKIVDKFLYVIFGGIILFAIITLIHRIIKGEIPFVVLISFGCVCLGCFSILAYKLWKKYKK